MSDKNLPNRELFHNLDTCSSTADKRNEFNDWVYVNRMKQYTISKAEIRQRFHVSDSWIQKTTKSISSIRASADFSKGGTSVFYDEDEFDKLLKNISTFTMRTVKVNLKTYFPKQFSDISKFIEYDRVINSNGFNKSDLSLAEKEEYERLKIVVSTICPAFFRARNYNDYVLCMPVKVKFNGKILDSEIITPFGRSTRNNYDDLTLNAEADTIFNRRMFVEAAIKVEMNGTEKKAGKRFYIACDYGSDKPHVVDLALWLQFLREKKLPIDDLLGENCVLDDEAFPLESFIYEEADSAPMTEFEAQTSLESEEPTAAITKETVFNELQQKAINMIVDQRRQYCFLTGGPGTGKSFVLMEAIRQLREKGVNVEVCGPTGICAEHIGGRTINSLFTIDYNERIPYDTEGTEPNEKLILADCFAIDEVSMLRADLFVHIIRTIEKIESMSTKELYCLCFPNEIDLVECEKQPLHQDVWEKLDKHTPKQLIFCGDF